MRVRTRRPEGWTPPKFEGASAAPDSLAAFLNEKKNAPRAPRGARGRQFTRAEVSMRDAERRAKSGQWDDATPSTLVGLYAVMHRMAYGVPPEEFTSEADFASATRACSALLRGAFEGDAVEFAAFLRWAWMREKKRIQWARESGRDVNRLVWRWVFNRSKVGDYRVEQKTRRG